MIATLKQSYNLDVNTTTVKMMEGLVGVWIECQGCTGPVQKLRPRKNRPQTRTNRPKGKDA